MRLLRLAWGAWLAALLVLVMSPVLMGVGSMFPRPQGIPGELATDPPADVTVNSDGSYSPTSVTTSISANGGLVEWTGFGRRDSVVRITDPTGSDPCSDSFKVTYDAIADEFTGPTRGFVPGFWTLVGAESIQQTIATADPPGWDCSVQAAGLEFCQNTTAGPLAPQVYEYSWINGFKVDVDWDDVETAENTYVWTTIDAALNSAAAQGKVISVGFTAGVTGTPAWLSGASPAVTLYATQDSIDATPGPVNCGDNANMGRPGDANFDHHYFDDATESLLADFAEHVNTNAKWRQTLAGVRLSGANQRSPEAKLPRSCSDTTPANNVLDTMSAPDACICNAKVWANAGWTAAEIVSYYSDQAAAIQEYLGPMPMDIPLQQAGWPQARAGAPINFVGDHMMDTDGVTPLLVGGTQDDNDNIPTAIDQTESFQDRLINTYKSTGLLQFMHHGLDILPVDQSLPACAYAQAVSTSFDPPKAPLFPFGTPLAKPHQNGCPNLWAVEPGLEETPGIPAGFQNENEAHGFGADTDPVETGEDVASMMWNLTTGSNGLQQELYPKWAWQIHNHFGTTTDIDARTCTSITAGVGGTCAKTLTEWNNELVTRRESFPGSAFPSTHSFAFTTPGTYYYYNPRTCSAGVGKWGKITVTP